MRLKRLSTRQALCAVADHETREFEARQYAAEEAAAEYEEAQERFYETWGSETEVTGP